MPLWAIACGVAFCSPITQANEQSLAFTSFESKLDDVINQVEDKSWYIDQVKNLSVEYAPLSSRELAFALYIECVNDTSNTPPTRLIDKNQKSADPNYFVALKLCQRYEEKQNGNSAAAFQSELLAYRHLGDITSPALKYLAATFYADTALKNGRFVEGVKATQLLLNIGTANNRDNIISYAYSSRALLRTELKSFDKAIKDINKAIEHSHTHYDRVNRLLDKAYIYSVAEHNSKAISIYDDVMADPKNADDDVLKLIVYSNLSYIYSNTQQKEENLAVTQKQLDLAKQVNDDFYLAQAKLSRAYALLDVGRYQEAQVLFAQGDSWFANNDYDVRTAEGYADWAEILYEQERFKAAYEYLNKSVEYFDDIEASKANKESNFIEVLLDAEAKRKELSEARLAMQLATEREDARRRLVLVLVVGGILFLSLIVYAYLRVKRLNKILRHENNIDQLTGAFNRRYFYRYLAEQKRLSTSTLLIGLIDIDYFKQLNDTYGHDFGDKVLQIVVERLKNTTKQCDRVIRWGGEEFLICLSTGSSAEDMEKTLTRILSEVNTNPVHVADSVVPVTISMGFKLVALDLPIKDELQDVDNYLYQAKEKGRKRAIGRIAADGADELKEITAN